MNKEECKCGHDERFHMGVSKFCKFSDKTENWEMPEESKKKYLELGINELAVCPCKEFVKGRKKE